MKTLDFIRRHRTPYIDHIIPTKKKKILNQILQSRNLMKPFPPKKPTWKAELTNINFAMKKIVKKNEKNLTTQLSALSQSQDESTSTINPKQADPRPRPVAHNKIFQRNALKSF
jgi:hypothetical protein